MNRRRALRARQRVGKYRIERRLGEGGFAVVYQARDTIEGVRVALKIPHDDIVTSEMMDDFRKEVRMIARLDHPNVLHLKDASMIEGRFVIAFRLGEKTLADRIGKRMTMVKALNYTHQMLKAVAYAHRSQILHCDIKPENFIIFTGDVIRLADFGIAKVAQKTVRGSGSGTVGHMAPEQAMGMPSKKSDVFSLGLIIYRMLSGSWPEWPFDWPPPGYARLRKRGITNDLMAFLRKSIELEPKKRFRDADQMLNTFEGLKDRALRHTASVARRRSKRAR